MSPTKVFADRAPRLAPASSIAPSRIRAIATIAEEHPGTLRLLYGEDTLPTPDFIKEAGRRAIAENFTYYTPNAGYPALRSAIATQTESLHGVDLDPGEDIIVTASGMMAMVLALQATVGPGDSVVVVTPLWPNITAAVRVTGAEPIEVPMSFSVAGYALDFEALEAAIRPDTRVIALASPSNPTGWTATPDDWRQLLDLCDQHDLWMIADGVYERLVEGSRVANSPLSIEGGRDRTIVAQSFSKTYRMTGWRVGYAIAPTPIVRVMPHLQEFIVSHAAGVAQEAARVALVDGELFVAESQARYAKHRKIAAERLAAIPGVTVPQASGAFYVFPRLDGLEDSFDFCASLVRDRKVGLAPGSAFGEGGEGHVRICFAVDETTLTEALDRFEDGWLSYRRKSHS